MYDHTKEALKRHMGKMKNPADGDADDFKGSQKGPGETDHAPTIDRGVEEMRAPSAVMPEAPYATPGASMANAPVMPGHSTDVLGPEHLAALHHIMTSGGHGLDAKAAASAKEKYASIEKHKEGKK